MKKHLMFGFVVGLLTLSSVTPVIIEKDNLNFSSIETREQSIAPGSSDIKNNDWVIGNYGTQATLDFTVNYSGVDSEGNNYLNTSYVEDLTTITYGINNQEFRDFSIKKVYPTDSKDQNYRIFVNDLDLNTDYNNVTLNLAMSDVNNYDNISYFSYDLSSIDTTMQIAPVLNFNDSEWVVSEERDSAYLIFKVKDYGQDSNGVAYDPANYDQDKSSLTYSYVDENDNLLTFPLGNGFTIENQEKDYYKLSVDGLTVGEAYWSISLNIALNNSEINPTSDSFIYGLPGLNTNLAQEPTINFIDSQWDYDKKHDSASIRFNVKNWGTETDGTQASKNDYLANSISVSYSNGSNDNGILDSQIVVDENNSTPDSYILITNNLSKNTTYQNLSATITMQDNAKKENNYQYSYNLPFIDTFSERVTGEKMSWWAFSVIIVLSIVLLFLVIFAGIFLYKKGKKNANKDTKEESKNTKEEVKPNKKTDLKNKENKK